MTRCVGFIGAGNIARTHADAIADLPLTLSGVADIDQQTLDHFASDFGVPNRYEHADAMFEDADLDVVLVATPNEDHADVAVSALDRGLDVLVEKPLATSVTEAKRIERAARDSMGTLMVGFTLVFKPTVRAVVKRRTKNVFGDIYDVDLTYIRRRGIPQLGSWFTRDEASGGGALIDCGVHLLAVACHVLDDAELESVSATTGAHFGSSDEYTYLDMWGGDPLPDPEFSVEDSVRATIQIKNGGAIHLDCAWAANRPTRTGIEFRGTDAGAILDVHGEEATIYGTSDESLTDTTLHSPDTNPFRTEWEYLIDILNGDRPHGINTIEDGLRIQRLITAIYESANQNTKVPLPPLN